MYGAAPPGTAAHHLDWAQVTSDKNPADGMLPGNAGAAQLAELGLPPEARSVLYKTEMCKNFTMLGACPFGR